MTAIKALKSAVFKISKQSKSAGKTLGGGIHAAIV